GHETQAGARERPRRDWFAIAGGDGLLEPAPCFGDVAVEEPEGPQREAEPQQGLAVVTSVAPAQGGAEIGVLLLQPGEAFDLLRRPERRVDAGSPDLVRDLLRQREVVDRVLP